MHKIRVFDLGVFVVGIWGLLVNGQVVLILTALVRALGLEMLTDDGHFIEAA